MIHVLCAILCTHLLRVISDTIFFYKLILSNKNVNTDLYIFTGHTTNAVIFSAAAIEWCILSVIGDKLLRFKNGIYELIGRQAILLLLLLFVLINHYDTCNMHMWTYTQCMRLIRVYKEVHKCVLTGFNFHYTAVGASWLTTHVQHTFLLHYFLYVFFSRAYDESEVYNGTSIKHMTARYMS